MMDGKEAGFLLLTSRLGNPDRKVLTTAQLRTLGQRMQNMPRPEEDRDLLPEDLIALGYNRDAACRILNLLEERELLAHALRRGARFGCVPVSRVNPAYPKVLKERLGPETPGCLWVKGDLSLLDTPMVALVGSRDIAPENKAFAAEVGRRAAEQGYTLVSGNAVGADQAAQQACLEAGGNVISVVAYELNQRERKENVLYLAEDGYDEPFTAQRALSRNRVIHSLSDKTFVAQATLEKGGTWDGTVRNLRFHWSDVFCFDDDSEVMTRLEDMGACKIRLSDLSDLSVLKNENISFL